MSNILQLLQSELADITYRHTPADIAKYAKDWTSFYEPNASAILFPKTTAEVLAIVVFANKYQIALVPSGGRTGLSGGAVARNQELVVSFEKMNKILAFDPINQTVTVQAGVITEVLQQFAIEKGLYYPVDFASRGSSQIGGNIATNAGGIKVVKYGLTRNWITGLTFVTGGGKCLATNNGLLKNATGYDLRHLAIGSEGTLGMITEAVIQLTRQPKGLTILFLAVNDIAAIIKILEIVRATIEITAFEFLSNEALTAVLRQTQNKAPFKTASPFYTLIEFENTSEVIIEKVEKMLAFLYKKELIVNDLFGQTASELKTIWTYRERIAESLAQYDPYKNDISVLPSNIPAFVEAAESLIKQYYPDFQVIWYGHIADGNLHINILKPAHLSKAIFYEKCKTASDLLFKLIQKYKGSVSAEHGVGILKRDFIHYTRSEDELFYMKGIKMLFDPNNIMNPHKML